MADYAETAMSCPRGGIVGGTDQGVLDPAGTAARAQFTVIPYRFCDKAVG